MTAKRSFSTMASSVQLLLLLLLKVSEVVAALCKYWCTRDHGGEDVGDGT